MKPLKMNWVRTPWVRRTGYGTDALVCFDCFVPKDIFEIIKPSFEGYTQKNEKKTALYHLSVIGDLLKNNHQVELDGVNIHKDDYFNPKVSILELSENSTNETISNLAKLYKQDLKYKAFEEEVSKTVNEIFGNKIFLELSKGVKIPEDSRFETFRIGEQKYQIDFKYGVERAITYDEVSHENFHEVSIYRAIPSKNKLPELKAFLNESQAYAKAPQVDQNAKWLPGFNASAYEPRKKNGYRP
jgi:hypothetical protein